MSGVKSDDKTLNASHEHLEHNQHKAPVGAIEQVLGNGFGSHVSSEDRAAALKIAREADPGPAFNSIRYMRFTMLAMVACVCSGDNGNLSLYKHRCARLTLQDLTVLL